MPKLTSTKATSTVSAQFGTGNVLVARLGDTAGAAGTGVGAAGGAAGEAGLGLALAQLGHSEYDGGTSQPHLGQIHVNIVFPFLHLPQPRLRSRTATFFWKRKAV
jgi:hypothetical protein